MPGYHDDRYADDTAGSPLARMDSPITVRRPSLLEILIRRQRTVAIILFSALVIAMAYLLLATPKYTSSSRIYVEQNGPKLLNETQEGMLSRSDNYLYTQAEVIQSMPILTAALNTPGVSHAKIFHGVDNSLMYLKKKLMVDVGKKDDIISVAIESPDPQEAATIVNAIVNSYVIYESRQKHSTAAEVLKVLSSEKEKHEAELATQQSVLLAFKQSNGDVFFKTEKGNIVMQDLANVSEELSKARLLCAEAEAMYASGNNRTFTYTTLMLERERVKRFEQVYDATQQKALSLNAKTAEFDKLTSDIARTERIIELLDTRMKEVNVTEDAGPLNISILEEARAMDKPTSPQRTLTMAIALLLGLTLGAGGAFVHDWMDQRLRSAQEVGDLLGLTVLGVVPNIEDDSRVKIELEPMSDVAEAYRSLRTAIHFGLPDRTTKTILITSPSPGDGKSTSARNLAVALAQAQRRTLLIDADLRRPVQHTAFDLSGKLGLADVIVGAVKLEEAVQQTEVEGLQLLSCGTIPPNPAEILNSHAFVELLERVADEYDQIIVDSPPVLPVTDASILGALCDVTIMVLRAEKSTRGASAHACEKLIGVGAMLIGAVVNGVPRRKAGYGGYGYYGGYSQYHQYTSVQTANGKSAKPSKNGHHLEVGVNGNGNGNGTTNGHGKSVLAIGDKAERGI